MENKFYTPTDAIVHHRHENYKTYLTEKRKEARRQIDATNTVIKNKRDRIKKLEAELSERLEARKLYKKDEQSVDTEYSYRKKLLLYKRNTIFLMFFGMVMKMCIQLGFIQMTLMVVMIGRATLFKIRTFMIHIRKPTMFVLSMLSTTN